MLQLVAQNRFVIFLVSFILLLFGNIVIDETLREEATLVLLLQNLVCSAVIFINRPRKEKYAIALVIIFAGIGSFYQYRFEQQVPLLLVLIFFTYFLLVGYRLFSEILSQRDVTLQTVAAVFCGFMLIALIASMVFMALDPDGIAFKGVVPNNSSSYLYFSFITLLTIGYGDITPTTELTQRLVVLFGLIGHFYTVFVIAIIVGKYLSQSNAGKRS